ncbi:hypothetical protein FRC09_005328, partial [Ceratobasidium sp. 395]
YRTLKCLSATFGRRSRYVSNLCTTWQVISKECEELVEDTEACILLRDSELAANVIVVPLSAIKATFVIWEVQLALLCELVDQLEAGLSPSHNSEPPWWPPGPLTNILLQRAANRSSARLGYRGSTCARRTTRLAELSPRVPCTIHVDVLNPADPLASVKDGYRLNAACVSGRVSAQTGKSIAYVGTGVPRRLAVVHTRLLAGIWL